MPFKDTKYNNTAAGNQNVLGAVDIGSSKITCLIGRTDADGRLQVLGCGWQRASGIRSGNVIDLGQAEGAIRAVVAQAESLADVTLRSVTVNLSCGQPESRLFNVRTAIGGRAIADGDVRRACDEGRSRAYSDGRTVVYVNPTSFSVDETAGVSDPRGHHCSQLTTQLHIVDAVGLSVKNLNLTLSRCDLDIDSLVATPLASALSVLVDDERELGSIVIDVGGGITSFSVFSDGKPFYTGQIPLGGLHITRDIAGMVSTPVDNAERLKVIYGNAEGSSEDDREFINIQQIGDDHAFERVPRAKIVAAIRPRLEEIFEILRDRLENAGLGRNIAGRVVLTGGSSQLDGIGPLAARILARPVRLGRPIGVRGLPTHATGPAFSAAAGLLMWKAQAGRLSSSFGDDKGGGSGYMSRIVEFIRKRI